MKLIQIFLLIFISSSITFAQEETAKEENKPEEETTVVNENNKQMKQDLKTYYDGNKSTGLYYIASGAITTALGLKYRNDYEQHYPHPVQNVLEKNPVFPYNDREKFPYMEEKNQFPYFKVDFDDLNPFHKEKKGYFGFGPRFGGGDFPRFGGRDNPDFYLGFSYPMIAIGLFHLGAGSLMYFGSDKKQRDAEKEIDSNSSSYKDEETKKLDRMSQMNTYFKYFNYSMIGGGVLAMYAGSVNNSEYMKGLGFGFLIQGILSYTLDYFAEKKFANYKDKVFQFQVNYVPATRTQNTYALQNGSGGLLNEGQYILSMTYRF